MGQGNKVRKHKGRVIRLRRLEFHKLWHRELFRIYGCRPYHATQNGAHDLEFENMINQRVRWLSTMLYCNAVVPSVEFLKMIGRDRPRACAIQGRRASGHRGFVREYLQFFGTDTASGRVMNFQHVSPRKRANGSQSRMHQKSHQTH